MQLEVHNGLDKAARNKKNGQLQFESIYGNCFESLGVGSNVDAPCAHIRRYFRMSYLYSQPFQRAALANR
ncbi:hypothetical protein OKW41_005313 [Paraburkholderia sp. UCT70]|uniref:hypothetical protein n=1 Tax=Paraburkholderia sp. UCT70 TaxID=2991068 RepID=UPI003D1F50F1